MSEPLIPPEWRSNGIVRLDGTRFALSSDRILSMTGMTAGVEAKVTAAWELPDDKFGLLLAIGGLRDELLLPVEVLPNLDEPAGSEIALLTKLQLNQTQTQLAAHLAAGAARLLAEHRRWSEFGRRRRDLEVVLREVGQGSEQWMLEVVECHDLGKMRLGLRLLYTSRETVGEWRQIVSYREVGDLLHWEASLPAFLSEGNGREGLVRLFEAAGELIAYELQQTKAGVRRPDIEALSATYEPRDQEGPVHFAFARAYELPGSMLFVVVEVSMASGRFRFVCQIDCSEIGRAAVTVRLPFSGDDSLPEGLKQVLGQLVLENPQQVFFDGRAGGFSRRSDLEGFVGLVSEQLFDEQLGLSERTVRAEVREVWVGSGEQMTVRFRIERPDREPWELFLSLDRQGDGIRASHRFLLPSQLKLNGSEHQAITAAFTRVRRATLREGEVRARRERPEFVNLTVELPADDAAHIVTVRALRAVAYGGEELDVLVELKNGSGDSRRELVTFYEFVYLPEDHACTVHVHARDLDQREVEAVQRLGACISEQLRESGDWGW